jgi:hypothetical protein
MRHENWPVAVTAIEGASAATVAWRARGQLYVSVVVKGTFVIVPGGAMTIAAPDPIAADEQDGEGGIGLRTAGDLAPYLRQVDVYLTGKAYPPADAAPAVTPSAPAHALPRSISVRLAVARQGAPLPIIDKSLDLDISIEDAAEAWRGPTREHGGRPVRIAGMGPLSKHWPIRSRLLGAVDPRKLEGPIIEIPEVFDWAYFQGAPLDQRIDMLHGSDRIILEGMHPKLARIEAAMPNAQGAARLFGHAPGLRTGRQVALVADTLRIDADRLRCSILWRGRFPVASEKELTSMHIVAGVELNGQPMEVIDPFRDAPAANPTKSAQAPSPALKAPQAAGPQSALRAAEATPLGHRGQATQPAAGANQAPLAAPSVSPEEAIQQLGGTIDIGNLDPALFAKLKATPFGQPRDPRAQSIVRPASTPAAEAPPLDPREAIQQLSGTIDVGDLDPALFAKLKATPFPARGDLPAPSPGGSRPGAPAAPAAPKAPTAITTPEGLDRASAIEQLRGTIDINNVDPSIYAALQATPFERRPPPAAARPLQRTLSPPAPASPPPQASGVFSRPEGTPLRAAPPPPLGAVASTSVVEPPLSLGAAFLEAMEEALGSLPAPLGVPLG